MTDDRDRPPPKRPAGRRWCRGLSPAGPHRVTRMTDGRDMEPGSHRGGHGHVPRPALRGRGRPAHVPPPRVFRQLPCNIYRNRRPKSPAWRPFTAPTRSEAGSARHAPISQREKYAANCTGRRTAQSESKKRRKRSEIGSPETAPTTKETARTVMMGPRSRSVHRRDSGAVPRRTPPPAHLCSEARRRSTSPPHSSAARRAAGAPAVGAYRAGTVGSRHSPALTRRSARAAACR